MDTWIKRTAHGLSDEPAHGLSDEPSHGLPKIIQFQWVHGLSEQHTDYQTVQHSCLFSPSLYTLTLYLFL